MKPFRIEEHKNYDKFFHILGPEEDDILIRINNDDVDEEEVRKISEKIVRILNEHWDDAKFAERENEEELAEFERWLTDTFDEIASDESNGESIHEMEIKGEDPMVIEFSVDAGRAGVHYGNTIRITKDKKVIMNLAEVIDSGSIKGLLKTAIEEKIK